jgi:hypothetical protein
MDADAIALLQERRMRAVARRRTASMRDEMTRLRSQINALNSTIAEERSQAARQLADVDAARREAAAERDRLHAAWRHSVSEHQSLLHSTSWRVTAPLRLTMARIPVPLRRRIRQGLTLVWWALSGQLSVRLQQRRAILEDARGLRQSCHFSAEWYVAHYPDVATSGLDPALHYVTIGVIEGRDPGPRFSMRSYLDRNPTADRAALLDLLKADGESGGSTPFP